MLDFRMDTFLAVCAYMNYTRAAEALNITQPAVSQQIHMLEEHYKVRLFHYEGKSLKITPEGELLQQAALRNRHDEERLKEALVSLGRKKRTVKFGATLTIGEFALPDRLAEYLKLEPDCNLCMLVANTQELLHKLDHGDIDFAIVEGYFEKEKYESRIFRKEKYICVKGKDFQMKKTPEVFGDILSNTLVVREEGSGTREILERFLQEKNYAVKDFIKIIETNNMHVIKQLVRDNCGITFLYRIAAEKELKEGLLEEIALKDFDIMHEFTFIWQKGSIFEKEYEKMFQRWKSCDI